MSKTQLLIACGALVTTVGGFAVAQDGTERRVRRIPPVHEISPEFNKELRLIEAAAQTPPPRVPDTSMGPAFELEVRLESIVDAHTHVSVAVTPDEASRMLGVREVMSADDIADGVLFKGRVYASYPLLDQASELPLIPLTGQQLVLKLARRSDETAFVVGWRKP